MVVAKTSLFTSREVELAQVARALGHPARIAIVSLLMRKDRIACSEIVDSLPLAQATVSQHLKILKESGLVEGKACGTHVCYSVAPQRIRGFCREFIKRLD